MIEVFQEDGKFLMEVKMIDNRIAIKHHRRKKESQNGSPALKNAFAQQFEREKQRYENDDLKCFY